MGTGPHRRLVLEPLRWHQPACNQRRNQGAVSAVEVEVREEQRMSDKLLPGPRPLHRDLPGGRDRRGAIVALPEPADATDGRASRCGCCLAPPNGTCARCGGPACTECDRCYGCRQILCPACDSRPTPAFAYPGDRYRHPHNGAPLTEVGPVPAGTAPSAPADAT